MQTHKHAQKKMRNICVANSTKPYNEEGTLSWAVVISSSFSTIMGVQIFARIYAFSPGTQSAILSPSKQFLTSKRIQNYFKFSTSGSYPLQAILAKVLCMKNLAFVHKFELKNQECLCRLLLAFMNIGFYTMYIFTQFYYIGSASERSQ